MKTKLLSLFAIASALALAPASAVLVTDFGSASFSPTFSDFTSNLQTPAQITLDGTEGNMIFGDLATPVNVLGSTESLTITGIYTGLYNGQFVVELFDADGDSRAYSGFYANFTPSVSSTVNLVFVSETGAFSGIVTGVGFTAGSSGGSDSVNLVATNLSAVPEPGSFVFLVGGMAAMAIYRRRAAPRLNS